MAAVASGITSGKLFEIALSGGFFNFMQQLTSFWALLTHGVLNMLKRIVVIFISILFFSDPVTMLRMISSVGALLR